MNSLNRPELSCSIQRWSAWRPLANSTVLVRKADGGSQKEAGGVERQGSERRELEESGVTGSEIFVAHKYRVVLSTALC